MSDNLHSAISAHRSLLLVPSDLDRITAETAIDQIDYASQLDSTNNRARSLATEGDQVNEWTLVLADRQTAGRGRGANRWWSAPGALTFSVLVPAEAIELPASRWPQVSLVAGLAVCAAIEETLPRLCAGLPKPSERPAARLKWPNDVYLSGRKLCGILVEAADGPRGHLVVGIGLNVNNSSTGAPDELRDTAIALVDVTQCEQSRVDLLIAILQQLARHLERLAAEDRRLADEWRGRSLLADRTVEIDTGARRLVGVCRGIDDDGALIVETPAGRERCVSGVVVRFE